MPSIDGFDFHLLACVPGGIPERASGGAAKLLIYMETSDTHSTYSINSILRRGLQKYIKIAPYCRSTIECIRNLEKCRQRNTK